VRTTWGRGFIELVAADGGTTYYARARESQIELDNPAEIVRPLRLGVLVRLTTPRPRPSVTIAYPDGSTQRLRLRRGRARVEHDFRAPPGKSAIRFSTNARGTRFYFRGHPMDPQILYLQLIDPVVAVVRAGL
jgi:hypothetical protein